MYVNNLSFSYDPQTPLINDLSITVNPMDRICVIGKNGKGKTTLLKLFADTLTPHNGTITFSPTITKGVFEQTNIKTLVDSRTVVEEISLSHPGLDNQTAWNICGAMMFDDEHALKKISVLSGGEKSRVMLGKLLATPVNLLLLDEITNHLDMESCDALLAALDCFEGAVIMVTHNEMFLHALAQRLIVFQRDGAHVFEGTYQNFLEKEGWEDEEDLKKAAVKVPLEKVENERQTKKIRRQKRSTILNQRAQVLKPIEQRIEQIENEIISHEEQLKDLTQAMQKAAQLQSGSKIMELSQDIHSSRSAIDHLFEELEEQATLLEKRKKDFESRLTET
jgi:ATP-binding cassette subfamily F protein 3